jgi:hypothetical protein
VKWVKKLSRLISAANSKAVIRVEQSDWSRVTKTSVEVTVETEELMSYGMVNQPLSEPVLVERETAGSKQKRLQAP